MSLLTRTATLVLCALFAACGGTAPVSPPPVDPCATGTPDLERCVGTITWAEGPHFMGARDHHGTVIAETPTGAYLYILGGIHGNTLRTVQVVSLDHDGAVGAFVATTSLPANRGGPVALVADRHLIVTGGASGNASTTTVLSAEIHDDGTLGDWVEQPPMTGPHFHHAAVLHEGYAYVVGGLVALFDGTGSKASDLVERAAVLADGRVGSWEVVAHLPEARSHLAIVVHEGALYVIGGMTSGDNPNPTTNVLVASFTADGGLGPFVQRARLSSGRAALSALTLDGAVLLLGGLDEVIEATDRVERMPLSDGAASGWEALPPLPFARAHVHQTPLYQGRIYSTGGSVNETYFDRVVVGTVSYTAR